MEKIVIFRYDMQQGALADFIKFFIYTVDICTKHNLKIMLDVKHPISKYITINEKYIVDPNIKTEFCLNRINQGWKISDILKYHQIVVFNTYSYYNYGIDFELGHDLNNDKPINRYNLYEYFTFNEELFSTEISEEYECIHARLGDKYLEFIPGNWPQQGDDRCINFDDSLNKIRDIVNKTDRKVFLFSDNNDFKRKIKELIPSINIFSYEQIINIANFYDDKILYDKGMKDVITEFLFMTKATKVHALSYSGFNIVASYIGDSELIKYY